MKKELLAITILFIFLISTVAVFSTTEKEDSQKTPFMKRLFDFFTKKKPNPMTGNTIKEVKKNTEETISSTKKILKKTSTAVKDTVSKTVIGTKDCKTIICTYRGKEFYCPADLSICEEDFDDCRTVWCYPGPKEEPVENDNNIFDETGYKNDDQHLNNDDFVDSYDLDNEQCVEDYNDCTTESGEQVICHGDYKDCCEAFNRCVCGTDGAKPDNLLDFKQDSEKDIAERGVCTTNEFLCKKIGVSYSGNFTESTVECKGSYPECASRYGECTCANLTTSWFDVTKIGDTDTGSASPIWCDWKDKQVLCSMLPEDCEEKKNTCDKGDGVFVTCEGNINFCNEKYDDLCLCGLTSSDDFIRE